MNDAGLELRKLKLREEGLRAERKCLKLQVEALRSELKSLRKAFGFNAIARCLTDRFSMGNHAGETTTFSPRKIGDTRPSIAIVVDTLDWSFANIAEQLRRLLSNEFDISLLSTVELEDDAVLAFYLAQRCDLIHFMWRESVFEAREYFPGSVELFFGSLPAMNLAVSYKTSFTVYDHLFLDVSETRARERTFREFCCGYAVCSRRLLEVYSNITHYPPPSGLVQDGVDLKLFKPSHLDRLREVDRRPIRLGWVGNSRCAHDVMHDLKGFHSVLEPCVAELRAEGYEIDCVYADRQAKYIPHNEMPFFYSSIDLLVCSSAIEGTPNPVLEAMACGVPVISTDVGVVPEVFGSKQKQFILPERSTHCLKTALREVINAPQRLVELSSENLESIKAWSWEKRAESYRAFFRKCLQDASMHEYGRALDSRGQ